MPSPVNNLFPPNVISGLILLASFQLFGVCLLTVRTDRTLEFYASGDQFCLTFALAKSRLLSLLYDKDLSLIQKPTFFLNLQSIFVVKRRLKALSTNGNFPAHGLFCDIELGLQLQTEI